MPKTWSKNFSTISWMSTASTSFYLPCCNDIFHDAGSKCFELRKELTPSLGLLERPCGGRDPNASTLLLLPKMLAIFFPSLATQVHVYPRCWDFLIYKISRWSNFWSRQVLLSVYWTGKCAPNSFSPNWYQIDFYFQSLLFSSHERTPVDEAVSMGKMDVIDAINTAVTQVELDSVSVA